jgi:predicted nucleic acid-binding protein
MMKSKNGYDFVLDCSTTMAWLFEDESSPHTDSILDRLKDSQAVVPVIWPLEVANVLLMAERKKRITNLEVSSFIDALGALPIHVDESTIVRAMHSIFQLASTEKLTIYDASYLELAIREGSPLATQDQNLIKASKRLNIPIL